LGSRYSLWSRELASNELFSREEALGGLPLRRASFLPFLIESRTARMVAHAQQAAGQPRGTVEGLIKIAE
jgi:hypothetical protein